MSNQIVIQVPETYSTGVMPFGGPSSRAMARQSRREVDVVLGRAEVAHTVDQARAVLTSSALSNTVALVSLAEQCYETASTDAPYYEAIAEAYDFGVARVVASF